MHCCKNIAIVLLISCLSACSTMTRIGVQTVAPSLKRASVATQYEHDWDHFKESILAQLKLLELMNEIESENSSLLESLIKGYAGLGFGYYETLYLADAYRDRDNSVFKFKASDAYSRALGYSQIYFEKRGAKFSELVKLMNNQKKFNEYLDDHFSKSDSVALFYTTQSLASLINLNRDNVTLMGQINLATNLLEWTCKLNPEVEYKMCVLFRAGLMATRPKMLGGNPKKAAKNLKSFIRKNPGNALAKVFYLQYVVIPGDQSREFKRVSLELSRFFKRREKTFLYPQRDQKPNPLNLFNAIAKKRLSIMNKYRKEIF